MCHGLTLPKKPNQLQQTDTTTPTFVQISPQKLTVFFHPQSTGTVTSEERKERNALNAPYFLVALKDTEIMENTYLRFMVKVKGDPNPEVTLWVH